MIFMFFLYKNKFQKKIFAYLRPKNIETFPETRHFFLPDEKLEEWKKKKLFTVF